MINSQKRCHNDEWVQPLIFDIKSNFINLDW
jgi:hypothetical protein